MDITKKCTCNMFLRKGTCWHTGYQPTFRQEVREPMLQAVKRMKERIKSKEEKEEQDGRNQGTNRS